MTIKNIPFDREQLIADGIIAADEYPCAYCKAWFPLKQLIDRGNTFICQTCKDKRYV